MNNLFIIFLVACTLVSCHSATGKKNTTVVFLASDYAVIDFCIDEKGEYIERTNIVGKSELEYLDSLLRIAIERHNMETIDTNYQVYSLEKYAIQVISVLNRNRHKEFQVSAFCDTTRLNWRKEPVGVKDGGNCFFQLNIDLSEGTTSEIHVNGYAVKNKAAIMALAKAGG